MRTDPKGKQQLQRPSPLDHEALQPERPMETASTRRYYDEHAASYAKATCNANLQPVWRLLTRRLAPGSLILDLGCGAGRDLAYFSQRGFRIIGLDYSLNLLKIARSVSGQSVVLADLSMPPFAPDTFDAIWAIASLLHVPRRHIRSVLIEIRRLLKTAGLFLASMKEGTGERVDERGRYFADYSPAEWRKLLGEAGFGGIELRLMKESRTTAAGHVIDITWLVSLCTKD